MDKDKKALLDYKFWSTSITRFNAAKRITSWKHCVRWSLLSSSIHLTILSILLYSDQVLTAYTDISQFAVIYLSVLTLCLSLAVNLSQLEVKSFQYHECGRKIRKLLNKLKMETNDSNIGNLLTEYDEILDQYENHSSIDYYQFIYHHHKELEGDQKRKIPSWWIIYLWMPAARFFPQLIIYFITVLLPVYLIFKIVKFCQ